MKIGVPKETAEGERRVALVPDAVKSLKKNESVDVAVERGAGDAAGHPDSQYEEAGAEVVDPDVAWGADVVLRVAAPTAEQIGGGGGDAEDDIGAPGDVGVDDLGAHLLVLWESG